MSGDVEDPTDLFVQATEEEKTHVMLQNSIILDDLSIKQVRMKHTTCFCSINITGLFPMIFTD